MITIKEEVLEEASAWRIVKHLVIVMAVGFALEWAFLPEGAIKGLWINCAPIMYIAYLGIIKARQTALQKRDERVTIEAIAEDKRMNYEEKQAQIEQVQSVIERRASELKQEANAIKDKAIDLESIANDNATLGEERRTLTSQVHSLGEQLANADKEKQTLMQLHDKETQTLLTKLSIAEKEAVSLRKKLADIEREEEERSFKKSVKATWSSSSKNESTMNEKFGQGNWEEYVNK